ncbi:MAG: hypothetical protein JEZ06_16060 [Anaerolineaceae bacterium]|nr:hypothetical protein [Anaerolineaceae bacterium]
MENGLTIRIAKYKIPFEYFLAGIVLLFQLYIVFIPANSLVNWFSTDDAYYYFKTAQNIAEGHGITFDQISPTNGFHPLWMLVCIPVFALAKFNLILPLRLIVLIMGLLKAGSTILLYRLLSRTLSKEAAVVTSLIWCFSYKIHSITNMFGLEAGINTFFIIFFLTMLADFEQKNKKSEIHSSDLIKLGIAGILVLFSRLDNIFFVVMAGMWIVFRKPDIRRFILFDALLIIFSSSASFFLRLGSGHTYQQYMSAAFWMAGLALIIKPFSFYLINIYQSQNKFSIKQEFLRLFAALSISSILITAILFALSAAKIIIGFPRAVLIYDFIISFILLTGVRFLVRYLAASEKEDILKPLWPMNIRGWLWDSIRYFSPIVIALAGYMLFNLSYMGTLMPVSGQVKRWWGTMAHTVYGPPPQNLFEFLRISNRTSAWKLATDFPYAITKYLIPKSIQNETFLVEYLVLAIIVLFIFASIMLIKKYWSLVKKNVNQLSLIPLFAGAVFQISYYNMISYAEIIGWYWVAEMILIVLSLAVLIQLLILQIQKTQKGNRMIQKGLPIFGVLISIPFIVQLVIYAPAYVKPENRNAYQGGITVLEELTEPGAVIGSTGGGSIAYFISNRTIVNMDGLINSYDYYLALVSRETDAYYEEIGLDYVFANKNMLTLSEPYIWMMDGHLDLVQDGFVPLYRYNP